MRPCCIYTGNGSPGSWMADLTGRANKLQTWTHQYSSQPEHFNWLLSFRADKTVKDGDSCLWQKPFLGNVTKNIGACESHLMCPKDWVQHAGLPAPDKPCSSQTQWGHKSGCGGVKSRIRNHSHHIFITI